MEKCPVCEHRTSKTKIIRTDYNNKLNVDCPVCGKFLTFKTINFNAEGLNENLWKLSYWIRNKFDSGEQIIIDKNIKTIIIGIKVPKLPEQEDKLIRWIGDNLETSSDEATIDKVLLTSIIGAKNIKDVEYVINETDKKNFIIKSVPSQNLSITLSDDGHRLSNTNLISLGLTSDGWNRYEEIKQSGGLRGKAFMAMKFDDIELDNIYQGHFKVAVKQTGFDLIRLDEYPRAGLLDNHLREQIKKSRFLLADLTDNNLGAYWEAGYAEGLNKPVIYLCEENFFNANRTHFDTNHLLTIKWNKNNLDKADQELKDTIRKTLPAEAKMTDD